MLKVILLFNQYIFDLDDFKALKQDPVLPDVAFPRLKSFFEIVAFDETVKIAQIGYPALGSKSGLRLKLFPVIAPL